MCYWTIDVNLFYGFAHFARAFIIRLCFGGWYGRICLLVTLWQWWMHQPTVFWPNSPRCAKRKKIILVHYSMKIDKSFHLKWKWPFLRWWIPMDFRERFRGIGFRNTFLDKQLLQWTALKLIYLNTSYCMRVADFNYTGIKLWQPDKSVCKRIIRWRNLTKCMFRCHFNTVNVFE